MREEIIQESNINLLEYWRVIRKRKKTVIGVVIISVLSTAVFSLFMANVYRAKAVITVASDQDSSGSSAMQMLGATGLSGMADLAGVSLPGAQKISALEAYLKSNVFKEKVIVNNNLLPVLFYKQWDEEKKRWKEPGLMKKTLKSIMSLSSRGERKKTAEDSDAPTIWDGIRALEGLIMINSNQKTNTLTVTVDYPDPDVVKNIVSFILETLQDHLSDERKKVATANKKYLEEQLEKAVDPMTRQKIYSLLSKQVETALMAEVKGNIFRIIDPPKAPDRKVRPKRAQMVMISFVLSLALGVVLAFILENMERMRKDGRLMTDGE